MCLQNILNKVFQNSFTNLPIKESSTMESTIRRTIDIWQFHSHMRVFSTWNRAYVSHATLEDPALRRYDLHEVIQFEISWYLEGIHKNLSNYKFKILKVEWLKRYKNYDILCDNTFGKYGLASWGGCQSRIKSGSECLRALLRLAVCLLQ